MTERFQMRKLQTGVARALTGAALLLLVGHVVEVNADEPKMKVSDDSFRCITQMTHVRHFYVDNLAGNLAQTVAVATAGTGDYPEGSVLQLVPTEVMIKQQKGFNPA